jgi:hypothetical protein
VFLDHDHVKRLADICRCYADDQWNQDTSELASSRSWFNGPQPGASQSIQRRIILEVYIFNLFWDDEIIGLLVREKNRYVGQQCTFVYDPRRRGQPVGKNGHPKWTDTNPTEFRAFLGIAIFMGLKLIPTV